MRVLIHKCALLRVKCASLKSNLCIIKFDDLTTKDRISGSKLVFRCAVFVMNNKKNSENYQHKRPSIIHHSTDC